MATVAARGSGTPATTGTTWATLTNVVDGTAGTNPATYATYTNAVSAAVATIEVTNYGFSTTIGSADTLNSVSVTVRHFENNTGRFASVTYQPFDGATAIGTAQTATLGTGAANATATFAATLAQIRSATFKVRVTVTGAASTQSRVFSLDHVDVTADYTPLPPAITQAAYRWYDEGTEAGAVALAAQDTPATGDVTVNDGIGQLRVRLQSTNAAPPTATDDWQLQYEKNSSGTWANVLPPTTTVGAYDQTNQSGNAFLGQSAVGNRALAQSFLGTGLPLGQAGFYLRKVGAPTGNLTATLYAHTGTFGTSSGAPTGPVLTTSVTTVATSSLTTSYAWYDFTFDGSFTLVNGTPYHIAINVPVNDTSNYVQAGNDGTTPTHAGACFAWDNAAWSWNSSFDLIFRVYSAGSTVVNGYNSPNLTDGAATTNRLGAGTGSFVAGKVSETGTVTDVGWSANNYTELLWSLDIVNTDVVNGDTLRFRVLRNGATTGLTYTQVPTINIVKGSVPVTGTATGTILLEGVAVGLKDVVGTASGSLTLSGTTSGVVVGGGTAVTGTAVGSLTVTGTASGLVTTLGAATGSVNVAATASGQKTVTATATGQLAVAGTASGLVAVTGTAVGSLTLTGTASGLKAGAGAGSAVGSLTLAGAASGLVATLGQATGTITVGGTVSGVKSVRGFAGGQIVLAGSALGLVEGNAVGTATGLLTLTGLASGVRGRPGVATGQLTLVGLSIGRVNRPVTGHAAGLLTLDGLALGRRSTTGTASGHLVLVGTARGSGPEVTIGMWNGAEFVLMQYEHSEVVDWMLTPA